MAKKRRTPPPPRVQAPQRRDGKGARARSDRRTRLILYAVAALGLIALAVVLAVVFVGRSSGSSGSGDKQPLATGCTLNTFPVLPGTHVRTLEARVKWNSWPPTSGPHYQSPAPWNFYDQALNPRISLHNLEHGGIVIFYGKNVPASQVSELRNFWQESPNAMLIAPTPSLDKNIDVPKPVSNYNNKIVATAWTAPPYSGGSRETTTGNGYLLTCPRFDEKTFKAFRDIHRGEGPERYPVDLLTPGA